VKSVGFLLVLCSALASGHALAGKGSVKAGGAHRAHHGGHHHHGGHRHHGHHHHGSVIFGFGYSYYPAYYPYYLPVAYPAAQPAVYIEQQSAPVEHWWYYCAAAKGYYPYVRECPSLWQRVPAVPPR
jgi:hypothetical protein